MGKTRGRAALRTSRARRTFRSLEAPPPPHRRAPMLLNRDEIREDKYFDLLTEAILERDQPRTTDLFFRSDAGRAFGRRRAQRRDRRRSAVRPGAEPHQCARRADHPDQQRPHDPRAARLRLSDAVPAREIPAAAAAAERLVHPGRARHLEPAARQISGPLRHDEGHQCAAAELRPGRVAGGPGADPRERHASRSGCTRI